MMNSTPLSLAIVLFGIAATLSAPLINPGVDEWRIPETADLQQTYLQRFGYWRGLKSNGNGTEDDLRTSFKALQRFAGLRETGVLDDDTKKLMATPRCGIPDVDGTLGREKRYSKYGTKWPKTALSYFIQNQTPDLKPNVTKRVIARASKLWSNVSRLTFTQSKTSAAANIKIRFAYGNHGDGYPFDGVGGVLAHAFYPTRGDVHFDEAEKWTQGSSSGRNLLQVATHEFGHALGLAHSNVKSAVMYPYYNGYNPKFALDRDDINGIRAIYGKK